MESVNTPQERITMFNSRSEPEQRQTPCKNCRRLKVRCHFDSNLSSNSCARCAKSGRTCLVGPVHHQHPEERLLALEKKIEFLDFKLRSSQISILSAGSLSKKRNAADESSFGSRVKQSKISNGASTLIEFDVQEPSDYDDLSPFAIKSTLHLETHSTTTKKSKFSDTEKLFLTTNSVLEEGSQGSEHTVIRPSLLSIPFTLATQVTRSQAKLDVVSRSLLSMEEASAMFKFYVEKMALHLPIVVFTDVVDAESIRQDRPILFLSVLCASSGVTHPELQQALVDELSQIVAERVVCRGEKSLELVQALEISAAWYRLPLREEELNVRQLISMAATMIFDLVPYWTGDESVQRVRNLEPGADDTNYSGDVSFQLEISRALLGSYVLSSAATMVWGEAHLQWSPVIEKTASFLQNSTTSLQSDQLLCELVRIQRIGDEAVSKLDLTDESRSTNFSNLVASRLIEFYEKALSSQCKSTETPAIIIYRQFIKVLMQKSLLWQKDLADFKFPFTHSSICFDILNVHELPGLKMKNVSKCTVAVYEMLQGFLALDVDTIRSMPSMYLINATLATAVLSRLSRERSISDVLSEPLAAHSDLKVDLFMNNICNTFSAVAQEGRSLPASRMLKSVLCLKDWIADDVSRKLSTVDQTPTGLFSSNHVNEQSKFTKAGPCALDIVYEDLDNGVEWNTLVQSQLNSTDSCIVGREALSGTGSQELLEEANWDFMVLGSLSVSEILSGGLLVQEWPENFGHVNN